MSLSFANISVILTLQSLLEEKILVLEQRKDDARILNKRYTMEMNIHIAHMFHVATKQALLPAEQRTATLESIYKDLGVEFGKFEIEPYIEAMKSEIEISYPKDIFELIKARKASTRAQAYSSNVKQSQGVSHQILLCSPTLCLYLNQLLVIWLWVNKLFFFFTRILCTPIMISKCNQIYSN